MGLAVAFELLGSKLSVQDPDVCVVKSTEDEKALLEALKLFAPGIRYCVELVSPLMDFEVDAEVVPSMPDEVGLYWML